MDGLNDYHYFPLQFRDNFPGMRHDGGVIMEQIKVAESEEEAFIDWYNQHYFAAACARSGVRKGAFMKFLPQGQLVDMVPVHNFVVTWHVDDAATVDMWRQDQALQNCTFIDQPSFSVTCWEPVTPKITEDEVIHTNAAGLAEEQRARADMGDRVMTDRGDELKTVWEANPGEFAS
jgi:hypothetical protein